MILMRDRKISFSPTYEPPEVKIGRAVSRAYDIWSLACLYLEFITWLLMGGKAIDEFSECRLKRTMEDFYDDSFYSIVNDDEDDKKPNVRQNVVEWVDKLRHHPRCSRVIHDLLDLIMSQMLLGESSDRIRIQPLHSTLTDVTTKAKASISYMLTPCPSAARAETVSTQVAQKGNSKKKDQQVRFS